MRKRFWSAVLAALMVLNLVPASVLAEELAGEAAPIQEETVVRTEKALNAEGDCPHSHTASYKVTKSVCKDGCSNPKGTGELFYCTDCGKKAWESGWSGATYSPDEVIFDIEKQTVTLSCDTCHAEKKYSIETGKEITDEPGEQPHTHVWDEGTVIAPTCTQQGYTKYTCTVCRAEREDKYVPALEHKWNDGVVTRKPNCTLAGEKTYTCKVCGDTKTETLGLNDMHQCTAEETPATCEADGLIKYTCSLCGYSYEVVIPSGHEWEEFHRTPATCVAQGTVDYECGVCHQTKQETLPATGVHTWEEIGNTATCEYNGYISYKCRDCDATRTTDVAALGHAWGEWTEETPATCTAAGVEKRVCERGCVETRELPIVSHNYGTDHKCTYCGKTYPEVQAIIDAIDALPALNEINQDNALAVYNEVLDIKSRIGTIEEGTDPDHKAALDLYVNKDTVANVEAECLKYLTFTEYEEIPGEQKFTAYWNDNNETDKRTALADFLNASHAVLKYEIVSEDGNTVVASGTLNNAAEVNAAFDFLGVELPADAQLLSVTEDAASYNIKTNENLPVGYTSTYTDYTTGEAYTSKFKINYTLTLENPAPDDYITTLPERTAGAVTLKDGERVIFTKLTDWSASIVWYDDDNRSALGGTSTEHTPRVDANALKAATKVYYYPQGYNVHDGEPVVGDFGYVISDDTIRLTGLPAYDNDGNPLAYYISQNDIMAANADYVPGNRYTTEYQNVGNFSAKTNGVYDGGYMLETLYNTIPFSVTTIWADGKTPDERPNGKFYIWRITEDYNGNLLDIDPEFCYAIPNCYDSYDVPKEDVNTYEFVRDMGGEQYLRLFPMYDTEGRRYIYFGKESGLPGEYSSILDNSNAKVLPSVIDEFSKGTNAGYFLNGATITNTIGERTPMSLSKDFRALSLQNKLDANTPITATFLLQKKDADGNWISANVETDGIVHSEPDGVTADIGADKSLSITLTKFAAEDMSASYGGVTVSKYDRETHKAQEFRWVETGVSVNGVSAAYQPSDWVSDGNGIMHYAGDIIVYDGQTSTVLGDSTTRTSGPDDTTAIFNAVASGSHFTNQLVGKHQVEIRKYFVDENGNNIAADAEKMAGVEVTFTVYRNDEIFDTVTLTIADLSKGNDYWVKLLNYERYDEEGREYHFKVKETGANGEWNRSEDYEVSVLEYPAGSDILVKRLLTTYVNGPGPGGLEFDVEKQWLDDSDLQTRNPVVAGVYRFRDADGNLLSEPVQVGGDITLSMSNNWYKKVGIPAIDSADHKDSTENYVILEKGIQVDGTLVKTDYDFAFTSANLKTIHDAIVNGKAYAGITGSTDREDGNWDGLYYRYKLFENRANRAETPAMASYVLTNLRIGTQDYIVEKTWKAGGEIRKCSFGLFYGDQMIAEFTLDVVENKAQLSNVDWKIPRPEGVEITANTPAGIDANGNYNAAVKITGLEKFDDVGAQKEYSIQEIAIYGKDGNRYEVKNGGCQAGDEIYAVSVNTSLERADNDNHRAPDLYTVKVTNTLTGNYDLVSNKVWRDANQIVRPDVCFSVYRMSTQDATLRGLVDSGDTAAMSAYLAAHTGSDYRVITDRYWDTHINSYWWTCTVKNMQQYDANGYPYVYYAVEKISNTHVSEGSADSMSTSALYVGYYCNYTANQSGYRPTNPTVTSKLTTQQVFGVDNDKLCGIEGNVFILADGIHKVGENGYKDYYSATAVNRPERERTVSGKKLWKLPQGWAVSEEEMPEVKIDLYRSTDEISFSEFSSAEAYAAAIAEASDGVLDTTTASNDNHYTYSFTHDKNGELLPRYDKWGSTYYYYTLEEAEWVGVDPDLENKRQNFPEDAVIYEDNDFNISNIFSSEPPYVEVNVEKVWNLSDDVMHNLATYGLAAITSDDIAPAKINLYGTPTNSHHAEIGTAHFDFGSVTLTPNDPDSDKDGVTDTVFEVDDVARTLKATYTFKTFYNSETQQKERLPYYWLHNYEIDYYLNETHTNGYEEVFSTARVNFNGNRSEGDLLIRYNRDVFQLTNTYKGIDDTKIDFNFSKVWNDKYVGNDNYRPASVTFTVKRSVGGVVDTDFVKTVTLNKADFAGKDTWTGKVEKLLKYAPSGEAYVYFVESETVGDDIADATGEEIGNYVLTSKSNDRLINTLNENLRTTVEASKRWTVNGAVVNSYTNSSNTGFDDLRKMGVFPDSIQFAVQRKIENGTYDYVPASEYQDSVHKVTVNGQSVVGHEVDLATANASNYALMLEPSMKWENLPKKDTDGRSYTYRVIEILHWSDGTSNTVTSSGDLTGREMSADITGTADNAFTLTNDLHADKVRVAKIWDDGNGNENTRPDTLTVTVKPVGNASGKTFTLTTSGHATKNADGSTNTNANIYYSDYFYLPKGVAKTYGVDGAKYEITESYTKRNGAEYTQTVTSDGGNVVVMADGTYALQLTNTYHADRKTLNLEATKNWSSDGDWQNVTRPSISFKIQYYDRTAKAWSDITDGTMSQFSKDATQSAVQTVPAGENSTVTWKNMYKYWANNTTDGKAEFIRYRVVEVVNTASGNSSYTKNSPEFTGIKDSTTIAKATLTNELQTTTVQISKSWTKNGDVSDKLTDDEVKKLVALNAIPNELTFVIEYQLAGTSTWTTIPNGTFTCTAEQLLSTKDTKNLKDINGKPIGKLPQYDSSGNEISYRVRETEVKYLNGNSYDVAWSGSRGEIGSISTTPESITYANPTAAMVNDYQYVSLAIGKGWLDESNRDGLRGDISVTLSRDGKTYSEVSTANGNVSQTNSFCTVTKNGDNWALSWDYLPMYQEGKEPAAGNESVYTWAETRSINGYDATYDNDGAARREAENNYQPMRGTVVATKIWTDGDNRFSSRPEEIYLKLQYKVGNGSWTDVDKNTLETVNGKQLYKNADAHAAYTTSDADWHTVTKGDDNKWQTTSWENLPVKALNSSNASTKVTYRVIEGVKGADGSIMAIANNGKLHGYTVTYSEVELSANGKTESEITNKLDTTTLQVKKSWLNEGTYASKVRPESVTFNVEWKKGDSAWSPIPKGVSNALTYADGKSTLTVTVTKDGNWDKTITDLPKADADGVAYEYRVTETKIHYADGDVTVNGKMVGPYDMTDVTVNAKQNDNGSYTATATNSLRTGKLTVTKIWADGDDRDGGRREITVKLYRDGVEFDECKLNDGNSWTNTWTLPVRINMAANSTDYAKYTVKEVGEDGNAYTNDSGIAYTVRYGGETTVEINRDTDIENRHTPLLLNLTATKSWGNDQDKINVRPDSVQFKLQYRVSGTTAWNDFPEANVLSGQDVSVLTGKDSEQAYMVSGDSVTQTLNAGNNWTAAWHNLTANVRINGVTKRVEYRAVELTAAIPNYTPANGGASSVVTYDSQNKSVTISNELMRGSLKVNKVFTVNGQSVDGDTLYRLVKTLKVLPENLTVTLSYQDGSVTKTEEKTISFNESTKSYTTCTFDNLPVANANGEEIVYTVTDSAEGYQFVECGTTENVTVSKNTTTSAAVTNNYVAGSLTVTKNWVDENNRDDGRQPITAQLFRDGVMIDEQVLNTSNQWNYTWQNLPVYQNNSKTAKSVYTVKEKDEQNGTYTGKNGIAYTVEYSDGVTLAQTADATTGDYTASATITNTHKVFKGSLTVGKVWQDEDNKFSSRPANITLTLQYQVGADWVTVGTTDDVYTTSTNPGTISNTGDSYTWNGLPVNLNGQSITYRVVETSVSGYKTAVYEPATVKLAKVEDAYTAGVTVTNELDTTSLTIHKDWERVDYLTPVSATFLVEYSHDDGTTWQTYGNVTVNYAADATTAGGETVVNGLPKKDGQGNAYTYRVSEVSTTYRVGNGNDVTVNATGSFDDNGWSGSVGIYAATVSGVVNNDGSRTFTAKNDVIKGSLSVTKIWDDDNDRDGGRQSITVELYRDNEKFAEQTLSADKDWTATFTDLPVYQNNASGSTPAKSVYSVKEAGERNGSYTGRNNIAYAVEYSDGVTLAQTADATTGDYTASATITNTHEVFEGSLTAAKVWQDEDNKYGSRPANITLTLQYQVGADWVTVGTTDDVYTTSTNPGTISNTGSYTWNGLPVNLNGQSITYRVVETSVSGYKTAVYEPATVKLAKAEDAYTAGVTVTNELDTTSLTIHKDWESVSYLTPISANFKVQYKHGNSDWLDYDGAVSVTYSATTNGGETVISGLPKTDGQGNAYTYRVRETTTTYSSGSMHTTSYDEGSFDENGTWSGNPGVYSATVSGVTNDDGSFTFNANNEVIKGRLSVTKIWDDDNDRDAGRQSVTVELYRDGVKFDEATLSADKDWMATFTNLPVYQNTSSSEMPAKSVYTLKELDLNEAGQYVGNNDRLYEVSYVDGVSLNVNDDGTYSAEASLTNTHEPLSFSVKAMKAWEDTKDYGIRPDVQLELRWATSADSADWTLVEQSATAPEGGDGKTVTTTSPVRQTLKNEDQTVGETWGSAQWDNLPAYVIAVVDGVETSVPVYYKAFEVGEIPEVYESAESAAVSYDNAQGDDMIATVQVVNTLKGKMSVTVQKTWKDDREQYNAHADSITVQLQYVTSDTDTAWKDIPVDGRQVLSADSTIPWSYTWENLRNDYTYRVIELDMTFGDVVLKTLPAGGTEGEIGGYTYKAEATVNDDRTMTQCEITNELIVGKIEVTKTWEDSHDRDGMRPETLTFQLYRDNGTEPIATLEANVTADGIEKCVFENIPVYQEGTRELSHYYVVETDEDGYSITYDVDVDSAVSLSDAVTDVTAVTDQTTPVTNRHETILFRVEATKTWDDANDPYGLRPTEVSVKLQYAFNPDSEEWTDVTVVTAVPDPAEDDGKLVFTTSELIQTLTREDLLEEDGDVWGTAAWENLPAYALMPMADGEYVSTPVYYRVVEVESVAESYGSYASDPMCYEDAEGDAMTASDTVTNRLEDRTKLTVTKKWSGGKLNVQIVAQLQYRVDADSEWAPVPKNAEVLLSADNNWTHTFTDLRADYEYRCVEIGLINARGRVTSVRVLRDKGDSVYGRLLSYSSISETKTEMDELGHTYYVSKLTNRYIPDDEEIKGPKTGDTFHGFLYGTAALTSAVGIAVLGTKRKKKETGKHMA